MSSWSMDFSEYPVLSGKEVHTLLKQTKLGDNEARQKLIESNLRLVRSIVARFADRGHEMDDLFQIGCIGLVKAIDDFDLSYDVKFSTYAVPKIIGEIKRYIRESSPLKVSRSLRELASRGIAVKDQLTKKLGRTPLISEIAQELGTAKEDLIAALEAVSPVLSLQQVVHEDEGDSILLEDQVAVEPEETSLYLKDILRRLDETERRLLLLRYIAEKSQMEVAADIGISQAQVSRIEKRILQQLRKQLQTKG
ncbi:MAG: SigB/SigF/SigG family RNA polymerase sigma factor [Firmicutes bacterium]|nr:SigB/SigF/SigG family RNA polymerase sigma factor [Bacillota bacterium]